MHSQHGHRHETETNKSSLCIKSRTMVLSCCRTCVCVWCKDNSTDFQQRRTVKKEKLRNIWKDFVFSTQQWKVFHSLSVDFHFIFVSFLVYFKHTHTHTHTKNLNEFQLCWRHLKLPARQPTNKQTNKPIWK